ncbi:MAG: ABC transporter permease [Nitrospinae bacterium]|nr:ABC transporter permease [Nitrospinota bacterium]
MPMLMVRRAATALPSLFGVIVVAFALTRALPTDPAAYFAGPAATHEAIEEIRRKLGLDRSLPVQFLVFLSDLAQGGLGQSLTTGQPVLKDIIQRLPASLELTLFGLFFSVAVALPLGVLAATRPNSPIDHACRLISTAGVSLPVFFTGLLLVYLFYYVLGWAPPPLGRLDAFSIPPPQLTGFFTLDSVLSGNPQLLSTCLAYLALPAITLGIFALAPLARMTRASMLGVLSSDFIRTARASGLSRGTVLLVYAFHNAMLPVLTTFGMVFSFLLGANVVVERVFSWPGIGSYALEALIASDYAPVQGFVLTLALLYVVLNLLLDIAYGLIDPRVRVEG